MPHTPHTPHTPQSTPHTPGGGNSGPPSVPPASQESTGNHNTSGNTNTTINNETTADIPSDLNFDPAAVIDGEGTGQEALNVSISSGRRICRDTDSLLFLTYLANIFYIMKYSFDNTLFIDTALARQCCGRNRILLLS